MPMLRLEHTWWDGIVKPSTKILMPWKSFGKSLVTVIAEAIVVLLPRSSALSDEGFIFVSVKNLSTAEKKVTYAYYMKSSCNYLSAVEI